MQSLYDFTYEQMRDLAESFGWKNFAGIKFFNGFIASELQILML